MQLSHGLLPSRVVARGVAVPISRRFQSCAPTRTFSCRAVRSRSSPLAGHLVAVGHRLRGVLQAVEYQQETFVGIMGFRGFVPETVNGRAAQVGIVAGVAAELATGDSIPLQFYEHPLAFASVVGIITAATCIPSVRKEASYTADPESLGDIGLFTADAERLNGRVAMLAMMFILTVETMTGAPLLY